MTGVRLLNYAQKWQTLMAAFLAIVVAVIAYQGAKLAYKAAMAKLDADLNLATEAKNRKNLGICLRLDHATKVLAHEANQLIELIDEPDENVGKRTFAPSRLVFTTQTDLDEAWSNLDIFDAATARKWNYLRASLYNVGLLRERISGVTVKVGDFTEPRFDKAKKNLNDLAKVAGELRAAMRQLQADLS
ncbi:hypothetical protein GCM10022626_20960 [[Pseudomonas] carboxydohydrogena]